MESDNYKLVIHTEFEHTVFEKLKKKYLPELRPVTSNLIWTCKRGEQIAIKEMKIYHLLNTIRMIEDGRHTIKKEHELYTALIAELNWRKRTRKEFRKKNQKIQECYPYSIFV